MIFLYTGILHNASTSTDENDSIDIEIQCDMLFILACLGDSDLHRKVRLSEIKAKFLQSDCSHARLSFQNISIVFKLELSLSNNCVFLLLSPVKGFG